MVEVARFRMLVQPGRRKIDANSLNPTQVADSIEIKALFRIKKGLIS